MRTSRRSTPQDGFVQTKTLEDGSTVTALVVAPKMPGRPAPSILHLKGTDFLSDLRARGTDPGTTNFIPNSFTVPTLVHNLRTENVFQINGRPFSGTALLIRDSRVPDVFTSDDWVVFDCNLPTGGQPLEVRFTNGTITAKVNIEVSGNFIRYSVNDGPFQAASVLAGSGPPTWPVRVVLPIDNNRLFESISDSDLQDYFGTWTVETTPVLFDSTFRDSQDNPLPSTPFQFDLNGIVIEDITYQKKPNFIDPQGNEFYGGATFTAKARIVGPEGPLTGIKPNFAYSAKVRSLDSSLGFDGVVHELKGWTTGVTRQGTSLSFEWDGVGPGSVRYPPELDFGCSIWGLSTSSSAESVAINQNATGEPATGKAHTGPPGYFPENPFDLQVSPNPFIPSEEEYIDADGDGELDWNDYDNDGIPDGWPPEADTDGDGFPDVPPPDPFVTITASPVKAGYNTESWTIHVRDENGDILPDATFTGTNETPYIEWTPPADLEPQLLQASIHVGLCRNSTLPLSVRAQTTDDPVCTLVGEVADLAYGSGATLSFVYFEASETHGPFKAYNWKSNLATRGRSGAHWDRSTPPRPAIFKMGVDDLKVYAQFNSFGLSPNVSGVTTQLEMAVNDGGYNEVDTITLTREEFAISADYHLRKLCFPISLPQLQSVGRHRLKLRWTVNLLNGQDDTIGFFQFVSPKGDGAHTLYTVIDEAIPIEIQGVETHPAGLYPWYSSDAVLSLRNAEAQRLNSVSPLDQVTALCSGAQSAEEAVAKLVRNFYLDAGAGYYSAVQLSDEYLGKNRLHYKKYLQYIERIGPRIECPQTAAYLSALLAHLGVPTETADLLPDGDSTMGGLEMWTNYVNPIGSGDLPVYLQFDATAIHAPYDRISRNFIAQQNDAIVSQLPGSSDFLQIQWTFHQILKFNERFYDASLRFDKNAPGDTKDFFNRNYYFNQRNVRGGTSTIEKIQTAIAERPPLRVLPPDFEANSSSDYVAWRETEGNAPSLDHDSFVNGLTLDQYKEQLLYLEGNESLRRDKGYEPRLTTKLKTLIINISGNTK